MEHKTKEPREKKVRKVKSPRTRSTTQAARKAQRIETQSRRELKKRRKLAGRIEVLDSLMSKRGKQYKDDEVRKDPNESTTTLGGLSFGTAHKRMRKSARRQTLVGPPLKKRKTKSQSLVTQEKVEKAVREAAEDAGIKL